MAMLGKRFQRTISMSQIGPGSNNIHKEQAQAQQHGDRRHQLQEAAEHVQYQPANQWEILKYAEAMMMANSGSRTSAKTSEEGQINPIPCAAAMSADRLLTSPSPVNLPTHHFLDACFFCKRRLHPERDIFIYRGDAAFCTEECRHRQILSDEMHTSLGAPKKGGRGATSMVAA